MYAVITVARPTLSMVVPYTSVYGNHGMLGFVVRTTFIQTPRVPTKDALTGQLWPVVRG